MACSVQLHRIDEGQWLWRVEDLGGSVASGRAKTRDDARAAGNRARRDYLTGGGRPGTLPVRLRDLDAAASGGILHVPATTAALAATAAAWGNGRRLVLAAFDAASGGFRRAAVSLAAFRVVPCRCGGRRGCRACERGRVLRLRLRPRNNQEEP